MPKPAPRLALVDALRGFAVAQMIVYHFIYDLNYFGWVKLRMLSDQPWVGWRAAIVSQFLLLVGVGLVLRTSFKPGLADFWRRWAQVAGAALLVTLGSAAVFGPRFIWFGILHFIAVALLLVRPLVRFGIWNLPLGVAAIAFGLLYANPMFNDAPASLIGLVTIKPRTEDYVPLFPWLGVVLIGAGLGALWQRRRWAITAGARRWNERPPRLLLLLGTWALTVYLVHQPILLGLLWLLRRLGL
jgi:uncharacterized membrane protein